MYTIFYLIHGNLIPLIYKSNHKRDINWNLKLISVFIIIIFIRGFAYNTGRDYIFYYDYYINTCNNIPDAWGEHTEWGFQLLINFLSKFSDSPSLFFTICAIIITYSTLKVASFYYKSTKYIMFLWPIFMFLLSYNLYRQYIAISFMLLGYLFIQKKKWVYFYLFAIASLLFHTSSIVGIIILISSYYYSNKNINKWYLIGGVSITSSISVILMTRLTSIIDYFSIYYASITGQLYNSEMLIDTIYPTSSIIYIHLFCYIVWIWYADKICKQSNEYKQLYILFSIALLLFPLTRQEILSRLCLYFVTFIPFMLGIIISKYKNPIKHPILYLTILIQLIYYCYTLNLQGNEFPLEFKT